MPGNIPLPPERESTKLPQFLHGTEISKADSIKYLRVAIDSKVNWDAHVISTAAKVHLNLGLLGVTFLLHQIR